jgi:uncharacterized protein (TIGR03086 family)
MDPGASEMPWHARRMTEISDRYRRLTDAFASTVAGIPDDAWANPSPCEDWTARDVLRHVVDTQGMFLGFIGDELGPIPSVNDNPSAAWDAARAKVQTALDDPRQAGAAFDGFFGRTTFAAAVDRFLNSDLVIHRWDLARATGQDDTIDPTDAERVLTGAREFGDAFRSPGVSGPEVPAPPDADIQTRVLAFYGRRA